MTNEIPSAVQAEPTSLQDEPDLINKIAAQAQDASTEEGARHFEKAAHKLEAAYEQDKEWLAAHPSHANSRT